MLYDDDSIDSAKRLGYTVHEAYGSPHKENSHPRKRELGEQAIVLAKKATEWILDPANQEKVKKLVIFVMGMLKTTGLLKVGKDAKK